MKTLLKIIFFSFCLLPTLVQSQDSIEKTKNHRLRLDLVRLAQKQLIVGYEMGHLPHFSFGGDLGYLRRAFYLEVLDDEFPSQSIRTEEDLQFNSNRVKRSDLKFGLQFNAYYRVYRKPTHDGVFLGVKGGFQYADFGDDITVYFQNFEFGGPLVEKKLSPRQRMFFGGLEFGYNLRLPGRANYEISLLGGRQVLELINPQRIETGGTPINTLFLNNHLNAVKTSMIRLSLTIVYKIGA